MFIRWLSPFPGPWRAPEEKLDIAQDEKIDVYNVALVLWLIRAVRNDRAGTTEPYNYKGIHDPYDIDKRVIAGERPDIGLMSDYPKDMIDLIIQGWAADPKMRPTASEMVKRIKDIIQLYDKEQLDAGKVSSF